MEKAGNRSWISSRKGSGSLTNLLILIGVALVVLAIYLFVPPYFQNWKLGGMLRSIAAKTAGMESVEDIKLFALEELQHQDYHFDPEEIVVTKEKRFVYLKADYMVRRNIPLTDIGFDIHFNQAGTNHTME